MAKMVLRKRTTVVLLAGALLLVLLAPRGLGLQTTIVAVEDSYVMEISPNSTNGNVSTLRIFNQTEVTLNYSYAYHVWLKFNLSEVPSDATLGSVLLRLYASGWAGSSYVGVFECDDNSWSESSITWNNAPNFTDAEPIDVVFMNASGRDYDFNVTSVVQGGQMLSLVLKITDAPGYVSQIEFNSTESTAGPRLVIDYSTESPSFDWTPTALIAAVAVIVLVAVALYIRRRAKKPRKTP